MLSVSICRRNFRFKYFTSIITFNEKSFRSTDCKTRFDIDRCIRSKWIKNYKTIINGDEKIKVISAASIIAKVYRDNLMIKFLKSSQTMLGKVILLRYKAHLDGLKKYGVTSYKKRFQTHTQDIVELESLTQEDSFFIKRV